ncbi:unnamed protein product [Acanthoscelides obtectus]|uniref:Uncharacterized protein n=1 Tax=Acanthoscelides obtectus TaxID=200917 RepID=A0A9P0KU30_ACAOB|nr:unnamed protein product [Acanthoscelides obtectus]CAK1675639.1 hypothetical protein AOBTE_LOCUS30331 [Acanthoscelides obtectus]
MSVINAWLLYRKDCNIARVTSKPLKEFRMELAKSLANAGKQVRGRPTISLTRILCHTSRKQTFSLNGLFCAFVSLKEKRMLWSMLGSCSTSAQSQVLPFPFLSAT